MRASHRRAENLDDGPPRAWGDVAAAGWLGLAVSAGSGGAGCGLLEAGIVVERLARALAPLDFAITIAAASALDRIGGPRDIVQRLAAGESSAAISTTGGPLLGGREADVFLAAGGNGAVHLVQRGDSGIAITRLSPTDVLSGTWCLQGEGGTTIPDTRGVFVSTVRAFAAADAAGVIACMLRTALEHAKSRRQFGRTIGEFQAVKHRLADIRVDLEVALAAAWDALLACDTDERAAYAAASAASLALKGARAAASAAVQLQGALGYTWDNPAHLALRRAMALGAAMSPRKAQSLLAEEAVVGRVRRPRLDVRGARPDLRRELRAMAPALRAADGGERSRHALEWGLLVPHWPEPWGRDAGAVEQLVIQDELGQLLPEGPAALADWILGTLVRVATAEQHERWIRPSLELGLSWCQLFSETEAGSDLASLRTTAAPRGEGWVLNGTKVWTSNALSAQRGLCLARTDSSAAKHRGIGCFVLDMAAPGVTVTPIRDVTGSCQFNEVRLDDVVVPAVDLVGGPTDGWKIARLALANERVSSAVSGGAAYGLGAEELAGQLCERRPGDEGMTVAVGGLLAESHGIAALAVRAHARAASGQPPGPEGSIRKLFTSEHDQRVTALAVELVGAEAMAIGEVGADWVATHLANLSLTIGGGTSEIQRNVIAEHLLGLPRERLSS